MHHPQIVVHLIPWLCCSVCVDHSQSVLLMAPKRMVQLSFIFPGQLASPVPKTPPLDRADRTPLWRAQAREAGLPVCPTGSTPAVPPPVPPPSPIPAPPDPFEVIGCGKCVACTGGRRGADLPICAAKKCTGVDPLCTAKQCTDVCMCRRRLLEKGLVVLPPPRKKSRFAPRAVPSPEQEGFGVVDVYDHFLEDNDLVETTGRLTTAATSTIVKKGYHREEMMAKLRALGRRSSAAERSPATSSIAPDRSPATSSSAPESSPATSSSSSASSSSPRASSKQQFISNLKFMAEMAHQAATMAKEEMPKEEEPSETISL